MGLSDWVDFDFSLGDALNLGGDLLSAYMGSKSAADASAEAVAGLRSGIQASAEAVQRGREDVLGTFQPGLEDLLTGYQGAINVSEEPGAAESNALALSGALGPEAEQAAINAFVSSPGQKYITDKAQQAILNNAAATGFTGSGRVLQELNANAVGQAANELQNRFINLSSLIAPEQTRSSNISNLLSESGRQLAAYRSGVGTNLANLSVGGAAQQIPLYTGTGVAKAAGVTGQNAAIQTGINNGAMSLGMLL